MASSALGKALRSCIETEGLKVLSKEYLFNMLYDLRAFEDSRDIKEAVRIFVKEKYSDQLYVSIKKYFLQKQINREKVLEQVDKEKLVFVNNTTVSEDIVKYLFDSIEYALTSAQIKPRRKKIHSVLYLLLSIMILAMSAITIHSIINSINPLSLHPDISIEGNYTIWVTRDNERKMYIGELSHVKYDEYSLYVATDSGPEYCTMLFNSDSNDLFSSQLGNGKLEVKDNTGRITMTFKNKNSSWVLTK